MLAVYTTNNKFQYLFSDEAVVTSYFLYLFIGNVVKAKHLEVTATKRSSVSTLNQRTSPSQPCTHTSLSVDKTLGAKEGGEQKSGLSFFSFPWSLKFRHRSLACYSRFSLATLSKTKCLRRRQFPSHKKKLQA